MNSLTLRKIILTAPWGIDWREISLEKEELKCYGKHPVSDDENSSRRDRAWGMFNNYVEDRFYGTW